MKELSLIGIKKNAGADAKFKTSHSKTDLKLRIASIGKNYCFYSIPQFKKIIFAG